MGRLAPLLADLAAEGPEPSVSSLTSSRRPRRCEGGSSFLHACASTGPPVQRKEASSADSFFAPTTTGRLQSSARWTTPSRSVELASSFLVPISTAKASLSGEPTSFAEQSYRCSNQREGSLVKWSGTWKTLNELNKGESTLFSADGVKKAGTLTAGIFLGFGITRIPALVLGSKKAADDNNNTT
eukprot:TRINITY_DN25314_c0_g1_i1.p1 TRINITY_DN25314_c0_g1~~TRINITY_DN25314_c0_g1_i1.p1  ORF type:complete len:185 (-),score=31.39 TRINITY_DN25314_c0_g1_i1:142-696(-)